jgi:hypothetical protein
MPLLRKVSTFHYLSYSMKLIWGRSTLFLIAGIQYVYITYLGYAALPFVVRSELLLTPLLPIFGG